MIEFVGSVVIGAFLAYMIFEMFTCMVGALRFGDSVAAAFNAVLLGLSIWAVKWVFF